MTLSNWIHALSNSIIMHCLSHDDETPDDPITAGQLTLVVCLLMASKIATKKPISHKQYRKMMKKNKASPTDQPTPIKSRL